MDEKKRSINGLVNFSAVVEAVLHQGAAPFYRSRQRYPITVGCLYKLVLEEMAFYDANYKIEPNSEQAKALFIGENDIPMVKEKSLAYQKSGRRALSKFLSVLTNEVGRTALSLSDNGYCLAPDYRGYGKPIQEFFQANQY